MTLEMLLDVPDWFFLGPSDWWWLLKRTTLWFWHPGIAAFKTVIGLGSFAFFLGADWYYHGWPPPPGHLFGPGKVKAEDVRVDQPLQGDIEDFDPPTVPPRPYTKPALTSSEARRAYGRAKRQYRKAANRALHTPHPIHSIMDKAEARKKQIEKITEVVEGYTHKHMGEVKGVRIGIPEYWTAAEEVALDCGGHVYTYAPIDHRAFGEKDHVVIIDARFSEDTSPYRGGVHVLPGTDPETIAEEIRSMLQVIPSMP